MWVRWQIALTDVPRTAQVMGPMTVGRVRYCDPREMSSHIKPFMSRTKTLPVPFVSFTALAPVETTVPPAFFH